LQKLGVLLIRGKRVLRQAIVKARLITLPKCAEHGAGFGITRLLHPLQDLVQLWSQVGQLGGGRLRALNHRGGDFNGAGFRRLGTYRGACKAQHQAGEQGPLPDVGLPRRCMNRLVLPWCG
jgi:hypothetical protein